MKRLILVLLCLSPQLIFSQVFSELSQVLVSVSEGASAFADVDGDQDLDLMLTGKDLEGNATAKLYLNNGYGSFSEVKGADFTGVSQSAIAFADIDRDQDPDLLLTGWTGSKRIAELYLNNGYGDFKRHARSKIHAVSNGALGFADVEGDGDPDLILTGWDGKDRVAELYLNDGYGSYQLTRGTPFKEVSHSALAFADLDGDRDPDLLITGASAAGRVSAEVYLNDGAGYFAQVPSDSIIGIQKGALDIADADGDQDLDLLLAGTDSQGQIRTQLYLNDGRASFQAASGADFAGVFKGAICMADLDGDQDADILLTGIDSTNHRITKLYHNNGRALFREITNHGLEGIWLSTIAAADVDQDGDTDLLLSGVKDEVGFDKITRLYLNHGKGSSTEEIMSQGAFQQVLPTPFESLYRSSMALADIDGDSYPELLISGESVSGEPIAKLYHNGGRGEYKELPQSHYFQGVRDGDIAFADIDGDRDPDLLITGEDKTGKGSTRLYRNDGSGQYLELAQSSLPQLSRSKAIFEDVDRDGDLDLLISGRDESQTPSTLLYINDGLGKFARAPQVVFTGVEHAALAFVDIDGDRDADLLVTGTDKNRRGVAKLYLNQGKGSFRERLQVPFKGVEYGAIAYADVEGDGDVDILISGQDASNRGTTHLYLNDGNGVFREERAVPFEGIWLGDLAFEDVDADGDVDLILTGSSLALLYVNDGRGHFSASTKTKLIGVRETQVALFDVDGDRDRDLLITGIDEKGEQITTIYNR